MAVVPKRGRETSILQVVALLRVLGKVIIRVDRTLPWVEQYPN